MVWVWLLYGLRMAAVHTPVGIARPQICCKPDRMMGLVPERCGPDDPRLADVLALIRTCVAPMEGRSAPPSSMLQLTLKAVEVQAQRHEVWVCGDDPVACVFLTRQRQHLYVGKLAVAEAYRGMGFARRLIDLAETRAEERGLDGLELQARVELTENHDTFAKLGFVKVGRTMHPGYTRPTSITMRKPVSKNLKK